MKKGILLTAAFAALAPLAIVAGSAQAATNYVAQHVYTFNDIDDTNYAPDEIVSFGGKVAIQLSNGELWISDGTEAGTRSLEAALNAADVENVGIQRANDEHQSLDINGELYFFGYNGSTDEIYKTNGTTVTRVTTGLNEWDSMYYIGGKIYVHADGFFQVDPSSGTIVEIVDNFDCGVDNDWTQVQLVGGKIVFISDGNNCDDRLWTWDPASPSTPAVAITAVDNGLGYNDSDDDYMDDTNNSFTMFNGEMYFLADGNDGTDSIGEELFKTNGTQAGTVLVKDLATGTSDSGAPADYYMHPTVYNDELYFTDENGVMYKTDGTTVGTSEVIDSINFYGAGDYTESAAVVYNGKMITDFYNDSTGNALYTTDGTVAGTELLIDPNSNGTDNSIGRGDSNPLVEFDGHVFFFAHDGTSNNVWVTDGTTAGSVRVSTFGGEWSTGNDSEAGLVVAGDNLFFAVEDDISDGGTGEMALYKIGPDAIAPTGADLSATSLSSLVAMALVALAGAAVIARRRITKA